MSLNLFGEALSSINTPAPPHAKRNKHKLPLKGGLCCHQSGNLMTPKPSGKKDPDGNPYLYHYCGDVNRDGFASSCGLRNEGSKPFEELVIKVIGEIGRHPDVIKATLAASKIRGNKAIRPLQKKIAAAEKSKRAICDQIQSCVEMVKKLGADNVGDKFVVEMKALGDQKQKAEVNIETLKMNLQRLEKLIVTEAHVSDALPQFEKVFDTLDFAEQRELIELLIREIRVSKTHPDLEGKEVDPHGFTTKMRTSWYRVSFQFFVDTLFSSVSDASMKSPYLEASGYPARTRTLND